MAYHVFVSSMSNERDLAEDLAQRIRKAGAEVVVWSDTVLRGARGEWVDLALRRELRKADEVILILTERSLDSPDLLFELGAAFSLHKRVIPLLVGVGEVPSLIRQFPYVRYNDLHAYLSGLEHRAKLPVDGPPIAAAY
ncbi:MAG TPA: toll/interleukin-1 receptor domain-containing protein [Thermoanaerobaculia bacterium]|nr:toll/interleukin-1 receptor domain-containing protein [Thermoanaerobaculia bacterium]